MTQEEFTHEADGMWALSVAMAERFGCGRDDAEDVAQDVMLKLWCLHTKFNETSHLKASVAITTRRLCIDRWRTAKRLVGLDCLPPAVDEAATCDPLEYAELERWIDEQISHLPSTSGIVLRMRQLEGRELGEIASILGIQQTSVSTLLSRARNELLKKLKRRNGQ